MVELEGFVASHFGLVVRPEGGFARAELPQAHFKLRKSTDEAAVSGARQFGTSVARMVAAGCPNAWSGVLPPVAEFRKVAITASAGRGWVDFEALIDCLWTYGIPVVHLGAIPSESRKPDGMVTFVEGRPVIVLMKQESHPDWMLLILAHEVGHIACGHLEAVDGAAVVDEQVEPDADGDEQEAQANTYAAALLAGVHAQLQLTTLIKAEPLADEAIKFGRRYAISPGHAILNAAKHSSKTGLNLYPLARKTLNALKEKLQLADASQISREFLNSHLNFDDIKIDSVEFLEKLKAI